MIIKNLNKVIDDKKVIKRLKIQSEDTYCIIRCGKIYIVGINKCNEPIRYREFINNIVTDGRLNTIKLVAEGIGEIWYRGSYILDGGIRQSSVIVVDTSKIKKNGEKYYWFSFMFTQDIEIDCFKKTVEDGLTADGWKAYERIALSIGDNTLARNAYLDGLAVDKVKSIGVKLEGTDSFVAYSRRFRKVYANNKELGKLSPEADLEQLYIGVLTNEEVEDVVDITDAVSVFDDKGYLYLEPFELEDVCDNMKLRVIANRELDVEYYDNVKNRWTAIDGNNGLTLRGVVKLRMFAECGDVISDISIVQE